MNDRQEFANEYRKLTYIVNKLKNLLDEIVNYAPYRLPIARLRLVVGKLDRLYKLLLRAWEAEMDKETCPRQ